MLSEALGGRVEVDIVGIEDEGGKEIAVMRDQKGAEHRVALADVKEARLVLVWNK